MANVISNQLILALTASVFFAAPLVAQQPNNALCDERLKQGFNASGSTNQTDIFGSTFTFSRFVNYQQNGSDVTVREPITLKTSSPKLDFSASLYDACIVVPEIGELSEERQLPITDDNTCSTYLTSTCVNAIFNNLSDFDANSSDLEEKEEYCQQFRQKIRDVVDSEENPCPSIRTLNVNNVSFEPQFNTSNCPVSSSSDRDSTILTIPEAFLVDSGTARENVYNVQIGAPLPVFMAMRRLGTDVNPSDFLGLTSIVCVPATKVEPGSLGLDGKVVTGSSTGTNSANPAGSAKPSGQGAPPASPPSTPTNPPSGTNGAAPPASSTSKAAAPGPVELSHGAFYGIVGVVSMFVLVGLGI